MSVVSPEQEINEGRLRVGIKYHISLDKGFAGGQRGEDEGDE